MERANRARLIAYYLPQFHPVPENDRWWGNGFTEWTNVVRARPLYPGHYQPHLPADLGFYDLRVPEVRLAQADMARNAGIEGFLYWHYWFAGKRLLERPFNEVLASGEPDFPFCLGWANASWTGIWYGEPERVLIEQTYPGTEDYIEHFLTLLPALIDPRYITVDGKPFILIFSPIRIPEPKKFTDTWREQAIKAGLPGLHLVGISYTYDWIPEQHGFDAAVLTNTMPVLHMFRKHSRNRFRRAIHHMRHKSSLTQLFRDLFYRPVVISYADAMCNRLRFPAHIQPYEFYPTAMPNWDNTPRSGASGLVYHGSTPELFRAHLRQELLHIKDRPFENRIVILKSWNEWAEGNHLEPDLVFGRDYLNALRDLHA